MGVGIWRNPFGIALLIHLMILAALGYALHAGAKKEIQYIEVTMEMSSAVPDDKPAGGGGGQPAQDNMLQMPQQSVAAPTMEDIAQPQQFAESAVADVPALAINNSGMSTSSAGTGSMGGGTGPGTGGGSGGGAGTGTGEGTGHGSGGGMKRGLKPIYRPEPDYPSEARTNGWVGTVIVKVYVSASGSVQKAHVASGSGYDCLDEAAVEAAYKAEFDPALDDNGNPIAASATSPYRFYLN